MQHLEEVVGTPLLHRGSKGVSLTEAGKDFLVVSDHLIDQMDQALSDLRGYARLQRGSLTIAALPSIATSFMPRLLGLFRAEHPNIRINIHDALTDQVLDRVTRGLCDMGVIVSSSDDASFDCHVIATDKMVVICPPGHALATRRRISWAEVSGHPFIGLSRHSSTREIVDRSFAQAGQFVEPEYEVQNVSAAARMVEAGLGLTIVPELSGPLLGDSNVIWIDLIDPTVYRQIRLIKLAGRTLTPAAQAFWQHILNYKHLFDARPYRRPAIGPDV